MCIRDSGSPGRAFNSVGPPATSNSMIHLSPFLHAWEPITSASWLFTITAIRYAIEFDSLPCMGLLRDTAPTSTLEEVAALLLKDAITLVHNPDIAHSFFSRYFIICRKTGGRRPILDLRPLNSCVTPLRFRMVSLDSTIQMLRRGD